MFGASLFLAAAVAAVLYIYRRIRNLKSERTDSSFAALKSVIAGLTWSHYGHEYKILYDRNRNAKAVKSSSFFRPVLVLRDPILIKDVLTKDFEYFTNRAHKGTSKELFDLDGDVWRLTKKKLLPVFHREHLGGMFEFFTGSLGTLVTRVSQKIKGDTNVGDSLKICVSDIFSLAVFGLQITIGHKKDEFTDHAKAVIEKGFFRNIWPSFFGDKRLPAKAERYFKGFLEKKLQSSPESYQYNDFIRMILRTKDKIPLKIGNEDVATDRFSEEEFPDTSHGEDVELPDEIFSDAILQFLTSGYEPIVGSITFALYDLSQADDLQSEIRSEIVSCISKNYGLNHAAVEEMRCLDNCIHESLRLHPVVHTLTRSCHKDYVSGCGLKVKRGDSIAISILGLHMDEKHFPEPEKFNPGRFDCSDSKENFFYMPFGRGQRECIGSHFALLAIKVIVAKLIHQFKFTLSERSRNQPPFKYDGPYILPNEVAFNISLAQSASILS